MININWSTLLLQIVNFIVMAVILTRFFFKPVIKILDERSKKVTSALDEAERRERQAAEMHAEYEQKLAEAQEQVMAMKQQAQEELQQTKQRVLGEVRDEIQSMRDKSERELEEARQQAIAQHRRELGHLATTMSGQLMRQAGGEALQRASFEEFLQRLAQLPPEPYRRAAQASETETVHLQFVSATDLDADSRSRLEKQWQAMLEKPVEVRFKVDPSLVAGATVRIGSMVVDGSLAGQLQGLNERYLADLEQDKI
jgi:F-type H+-transporting ATPase subunit b